uniref:Protein sarah-like n=1 Tax=Saccoglossus kowalevskii TaxID=10224 RepID=A0ABM0MZ84_SACKO
FQPPPSADDLAANPHLQPPPPFRQFLISPPCSPPVGWGQGLEASPVINYDLLAALTNMSPGEAHELHPAVDDKPSIVVHTCEDSENAVKTGSITQTTCPPRR